MPKRMALQKNPENRSFDVVFHNLGLRSWIECTLCWDCPRGDAKGCCYYNPTYYPTDLIFIAQKNPDYITQILSQPRITRVEKYLSVDRVKDADGDLRCSFHAQQGGCHWAAELRESVCRIFVCAGCQIWDAPETLLWKDFFQQLDAYEAQVNQDISRVLEDRGLDLRLDPLQFIEQAKVYFAKKWDFMPEWCKGYPEKQRIHLNRVMRYGKDWAL